MYFSHLHSHTAPNNNLQRDAIALLEDMSNRLVPNADNFFADLKLQIAVINDKHPRCIPLHPSRYGTSETSIGFYLGGKITVSFHLYKVKRTL